MKNLILIVMMLGSFIALADDSECAAGKEQKIRMAVAASNIVNISTTRTPEGGPYQRQVVICQNGNCQIEHARNSISKHEPDHPDANADGMVAYPDIDLLDEISDMLAAARLHDSVCK